MRTFEQQLQSIRRGLALLARTRSRDDQRVMLGYLLKDLGALRELLAAAAPDLSERFAALEAKALAWRARLGAPVPADEDPETTSTRRRKEDHDPLARED